MRSNWLTCLWIVVALIAFSLLGGGCKSLGLGASKPSDDKSAALVLNQQSANVLVAAIQANTKTLASSLESVPENGSGFYTKNESFIIGTDGKPLTDKDGNPLKVTTELLTKVNNLQNFQSLAGVKSVRYRLNGYDFIKDLPPNLKQMVSGMAPCQLSLDIDGADSIGIKSPVAEGRIASAAERKAIIESLSKLAESEGAAYALKVKAVSDGAADFTTSLGSAAAKVVSTAVMGIPPELIAVGVTRLVKANIQTANGPAKVVAADSSEGSNATELEKAQAASVPAVK